MCRKIFPQFIFPVSHYFINFAPNQETESTNQQLRKSKKNKGYMQNSQNLSHDLGLPKDKFAQKIKMDFMVYTNKNHIKSAKDVVTSYIILRSYIIRS